VSIGSGFTSTASGLACPAPGRGFAEYFAPGRHHGDLHAFQRDDIAGFDDHPFPGADRFDIRLVDRRPAPGVRRRENFAVIHEDAPGDPRVQPRDVAGMVPVEVRGQDVVEFLDPQRLGRRDDPIRVPVVLGRITGVDEHRLTAGRDDDHRLAALDVDDIHVERAGSPERGKRQQQGESEGG
jgi:hypothetical protein